MKKKIVFLTDANEKIGFGHLNRSNLLAELFYKKRYDSFIFGVKKKYIKNNFFKKTSQYSPIKNRFINLNFIEKTLKSKNFFLIIDTFRINLSIQKQLLKKNVKWLQFDNFQNKTKIYADIVVNANPLIKKKDYKQRAHPQKKQIFLVGRKYLLIRNEFKKNYKAKSEFIMLCSGAGIEDYNYIVTILKIILKIYKFQKIIVILKKKDPRRKKILKLDYSTNKVNIIESTKNISKYFNKSKIVYLSGGTILIESLFYNIKRFVCSIATNQIRNCLSWQKLGFVNYLGNFNKNKIEKKLIIKKIHNLQNQYSNKVLNKKLINGKRLILEKIIKVF